MIISVSQIFEVPKEKVWSAITDHSEMIQWFFDNIPDFKAEIGFETEFDVKGPSRVFRHQWKVLEVIPFEKTKYSWEYKGIEGYGEVEFILSEQEGKTLLTLNNYGIESFPDTYPEFNPESCRQGWEYFIKERLKEYLQK